jgi:hypothetical protein
MIRGLMTRRARPSLVWVLMTVLVGTLPIVRNRAVWKNFRKPHCIKSRRPLSSPLLIVSLNNNYAFVLPRIRSKELHLMVNPSRALVSVGIGLAVLIGSSGGATVPFTEDFTSGAANWGDNSGANLLSHTTTGGPDGGAYATTSKSVENLGGQSAVLFRAQDEFNSSGHALEGNWIAQNVGQFSAYVRHNAPQPLSYFARFSGPGNFPGGTAVKFAPVLPNTWTQLTFDIRADNPEFVTFEGSSFNTVFSNVGHVQLGVSVPASLNANTTAFAFDIDKASITPAIPEPTTLFSTFLAAMALISWRRTRIS